MWTTYNLNSNNWKDGPRDAHFKSVTATVTADHAITDTNVNKAEFAHHSTTTALNVCTKAEKPLKAFRDHLATIASSFLIRPVDLQKQLLLFREAMELRMTVKDFLNDEIPPNRQWFMLVAREGWTTKDVEEELTRPVLERLDLRERYRQFVWTSEQIEALRDKVSDSQAGRLLDDGLRQQFEEKLARIRQIGTRHFHQACKSSAHIGALKDFIDVALAIENVNLDDKISIVRSKLALLRVCKRLSYD